MLERDNSQSEIRILGKTGTKWENVVMYIFPSIVTHPNFMNFHQKMSFKSLLESFVSISGHVTSVLDVDLSKMFNTIVT